jgi:hypothetical protein
LKHVRSQFTMHINASLRQLLVKTQPPRPFLINAIVEHLTAIQRSPVIFSTTDKHWQWLAWTRIVQSTRENSCLLLCIEDTTVWTLLFEWSSMTMCWTVHSSWFILIIRNTWLYSLHCRWILRRSLPTEFSMAAHTTPNHSIKVSILSFNCVFNWCEIEANHRWSNHLFYLVVQTIKQGRDSILTPHRIVWTE